MSIEVKSTCPFGHTCEKVSSVGMERCVLYLEMKVTDNITGKENSVKNCSFNWNVILQHETNTRVMGVQQATEIFRDEMTKNQPILLSSMTKKFI